MNFFFKKTMFEIHMPDQIHHKKETLLLQQLSRAILREGNYLLSHYAKTLKSQSYTNLCHIQSQKVMWHDFWSSFPLALLIKNKVLDLNRWKPIKNLLITTHRVIYIACEHLRNFLCSVINQWKVCKFFLVSLYELMKKMRIITGEINVS